MKHGARNDIPAEVVAIKTGGVMTLDSLAELGIAEGATVHVVAKAVNVLLVKP